MSGTNNSPQEKDPSVQSFESSLNTIQSNIKTVQSEIKDVQKANVKTTTKIQDFEKMFTLLLALYSFAVLLILSAIGFLFVRVYEHKGKHEVAIAQNLKDIQYLQKDVSKLQEQVQLLTNTIQPTQTIQVGEYDIEITNVGDVNIGGFSWATFKTVTRTTGSSQIALAANIRVLSSKYRWKCGSYSQIVIGEQEHSLPEVIEQLSAGNLAKAQAVVAIGTASAEIQQPPQSLIEQENLAGLRVDTLINALENSFDANSLDTPIYSMNFGRYNIPKTDDCAANQEERRVIIVEIINKPTTTDIKTLETQLRADFIAAFEISGFPVDIQQYSRFKELPPSMLTISRD